LPFLPKTLSVSAPSGRLIGPLHLQAIEYENQGQTAKAQQIVFDWNPWGLLQYNISFSDFQVASLDIVLPETTADNEQADALPDITLPVGLSFKNATINAISIQRGNDKYLVQQIKAGASLKASGLTIENLDLISDKLSLKLKGTLNPKTNYPHDLKLQWRTTLANGEEIKSQGSIVGDLKSTKITQTTQGVIQAELALELRELLTQPTWLASLEAEAIDTTDIDTRLPPLTGGLNLSASGDMETARIQGQLQTETSEFGAFTAAFKLSSLPAEQKLEGILFDKLDISAVQGQFSASGQLNWSPELRWNADISASAVNPATQWPEWPGNIDAQFSTSGGWRNGKLNASANIAQLQGQLRDYPVALQGQLHWRENRLDISRLNASSGNTRLQASGTVNDRLNLQWSLDSDNLSELYPKAQGSLEASGKLSGSRQSPSFTALIHGKSLQLEGYQLQSLDIIADNKTIKFDAVTAEARAQITMNGAIEADHWRGKLVQADIKTRDYLDWKLKKPAAIDLSTETFLVEDICLLSKQDSEICSSLEGQNSIWKIGLDVSKLPISLFDRWVPENLKINGLANASARLEYSLADQLLGNITIELPNGQANYRLNADYSEALDYRFARLNMQLKPTGIVAKPDLELRNGDHFEASIALPGASLLSLDSKNQIFQASARVNTQKLGVIDAMIEPIDELQGKLSLNLEASGTLTNPGLKGTAKLVDGSLNIPAIKQRLTNLNISADSYGIDKIKYRAEAKLIDGQLVLHGDTRLNAAAGWPSQIELEGTSLNIAELIGDKLPDDTKIAGLFSTTAKLQFSAPDSLTGVIEFDAPTGTLSYPLLAGEIENWQYRDARLDLKLEPQGIGGKVRASIGTDNQLEGTLNLAGAKLLALDWQKQPVAAKATLAFTELAIIEALLPDIEKLQGAMALSLDVDGTLAQPRLAVSTDIRQASVAIPRLGLRIDQINLHGATDNDQQFNFKLEAHSGEGMIIIAGNSSLEPAKGWPTKFSIKGNNFEASKIPEATVNISPDLLVEIHDRIIDIQGDLLIPYAKLQPRDITTAAQVSNDAVIIDSSEKPAARWQINSRINLILGDRVSFFGFGFEGQLGGNLLIEENTGQFTRGTGEIKVPQGRYRAYGQRLDIENGRLLFTGGPITNPGLDMRAVRKTGSVTAGIQVGGRLKQPRLELFSIPAMGQTDALSYLLLGRPMETNNSDDGTMVAQAALALGLAGGDRLARTIGDRFGLDEMRVESNDTGDQAALVVGRYLSPKLFVSYGVGLIGSFNSLNLRYTISEQWQLNAESGESHGADLLYTFER